MKKLMLSLLTLAIVAVASPLRAQSTAAPTKGHRVGVIDMAHVFQKYGKFEALRNTLQAEIQKSDAEAKVMVERLQKMQEEIKKFNQGSAEYTKGEQEILALKAKFDAFRSSTQRRLAIEESRMFKVIYTDVTAAVKLYAEYAKFDHVLRYNRKDIDDTTNPQEAVQTMNKTFIYTTAENDITDTVLSYLNKKYKESGGKTAGGNTTPVSRTR